MARPIRVAIVGQGYVATTLAVGIERIKRGEIAAYGVPLQNYLRDYKIEDIEIVASLDVDEEKIGLTLYEIAKKYFPELRVPESLSGVRVERGVHLGSAQDLPIKCRGLEEELGLANAIEKIVSLWERNNVDVILHLITTERTTEPKSWTEIVEKIRRDDRSLPATYAYIYAAMMYADTVKPVAFINAIPATVARSDTIVEEAAKRRSIVLGDDGASGATPFTSDVLEFLAERNRVVRSIAQFNIGGNLDFYALQNPSRNVAKEQTKSSIVEDILGYDVPHFIKPTGYLEPLGDKKFVSMHIEYISFNGAIDEIVVNMRINDSPALAGLLVDVIRLAKIALDRGYSGTVYEINAFYMKSPGPKGSKSISRIVAYQLLIDWLLRNNALEKIPRYSVHNYIPELKKIYGL